MHPAVFLDRDGVLIRDINLLTRVDQVDWIEGSKEALARLKQAGYLLVVVTNQPIVARGMATEGDVDLVHAALQETLRREMGIAIDRFEFCPHHPNADLPQYRVECTCRKPRPGMLQAAATALQIDLKQSFMVGDRPSDIQAGKGAGCFTIQVLSGEHAAAPIRSTFKTEISSEPDRTCADLKEAADFILSKKELSR